MRLSFRWRLFGSYLLVILLAVSILGLLVARTLERRTVDSLQSGLLAQAAVVGDLVDAALRAPAHVRALRAQARAAGAESHARVTIIAPDGVVLADTEHDPATMENHRGRPEVVAAFAHGHGSSLRYSHTLHLNLLYVASVVRRAGRPIGLVRLAIPLRQVQRLQHQIVRVVFTSALVAALFALALSARFSRRLTGAVVDLTRAARAFSQGDLDLRVRPRGKGDLDLLAESFNEMAARLKLMVREIREEKQQAETILARLGEAIVITDARGKITRFNLAAERVFGVTREQAFGHSVVDVTQNPRLDDAVRQALSTQETAGAEVEVVFPQPRVLEATVTPLALDEQLGAAVILHDVTELRRLESVRREFVANASHELQTPITAIKAMVETLLADRGQDPALAERFLAELERQADRLGALVRDLLDLAAAEAGAPLQVRRLEVAEVTGSVLEELAPLAAQRTIALGREVPEELSVTADWSALRRVLANLLDNAIKYTEPGGRVGLRAAAEDGGVAITVWDTGLGIPSADLPRIFERFYRVDKARSRRLGGTGLGLSIARHLTEAMGGRLSVESTLGKGSAFTVTLPDTLPREGSPPPHPGKGSVV